MNEKKTVIALGFFDGLHRGHAALLRRAQERAAALGAESAILTFDIHPDTFVKSAPVELLNSAADRGYIARRFYGMERIFYIHFSPDTVRLPWQDFMENVTRSYHAAGFVVGRHHLRGQASADAVFSEGRRAAHHLPFREVLEGQALRL